MDAIRALALAQAKGGGGGGSVTVESLSVTENGTYTADAGKAYSPVTVEVQGTVEIPENDVMFLDYDGSVVAAYSALEFAALAAMPANPSHEGLTAQGWNWTLANARACVAKTGKLYIGQSYITSDGKTRVYIRLSGDRLSPILGVCVNGTATIDWGDGSSTDNMSGLSVTALQNKLHTYAAPGDYVISITPAEGANLALKGSSNTNIGSCVLWRNDNGYVNRAYQNAVRKIEIGANCEIGIYAFSNLNFLEAVTIPVEVAEIAIFAFQLNDRLRFVTIPINATKVGNYGFFSCHGMERISLPQGVTAFGQNTYASCTALERAVVPEGVEKIDNYAFQNCSGLQSVNIPDTVTMIGGYAFQNCSALRSLTIPAGVTSMGNYALHNLGSLKALHFKSATPPAASAANTFGALPTDCVIYVPTGKLSAYTSAQYYPNSSSYTYVVE